MFDISENAEAGKVAFRQALVPQIRFRGAICCTCMIAMCIFGFWQDFEEEQVRILAERKCFKDGDFLTIGGHAFCLLGSTDGSYLNIDYKQAKYTKYEFKSHGEKLGFKVCHNADATFELTWGGPTPWIVYNTKTVSEVSALPRNYSKGPKEEKKWEVIMEWIESQYIVESWHIDGIEFDIADGDDAGCPTAMGTGSCAPQLFAPWAHYDRSPFRVRDFKVFQGDDISSLTQVLEPASIDILQDPLSWNGPGLFSFDIADPRTPYFVATLLSIAILAFFLFVCFLGFFERFYKLIWWECMYSIVLCIIVILLPFVTDDKNGLYLFHGHPEYMDVSWNSPNDWTNDCSFFVKHALLLDSIMTVTALYMPLRFTTLFLACLFGNLSFCSCIFIRGASPEAWAVPIASLILLSIFACRGAYDQDQLRWQTCKANEELRQKTANGLAMEGVARTFCDLVVTLTFDWRLASNDGAQVKSFFGSDWKYRLFTDFLSSSDATRFNAVRDQTHGTGIPGCITVTLYPHGGHLPLEAKILIVPLSNGSHILGISQLSEQAHPMAAGAVFEPQPTTLGSSSDLRLGKVKPLGAPEATEETIDTQSLFPDSSKMFSQAEIENIWDIGLAEHWILQDTWLVPNRGDVLGEGSQSIVCSGFFCGSCVAIKQAKQSWNSSGHNFLIAPDLAKELRILRRLRHPNIVLFHGLCIKDNEFLLILEQIRGQTLHAFCFGRELCPSFYLPLMLGISSALWYLNVHEPHPIVHGDLKPRNLMVELRVPGVGKDLQPHAKLVDFGLSRILSPGAKPLGGTESWRAPETFAAGVPAVEADIFSFGRVSFFVMTGKAPCNSDREETLRYIDANACLPALPWPTSSLHHFDIALVDLLNRCTLLEKAARPTWQEICPCLRNLENFELSLKTSL